MWMTAADVVFCLLSVTQPACCSTVTICSTNFSLNCWSWAGACPGGRKPFIWFISVPVIRLMNISGMQLFVFLQKGNSKWDCYSSGCDYRNNYAAHTAWFAMVILHANPKLVKGLFWVIYFWRTYTPTHELDTLVNFHQAGKHRGMSNQGVRRNGPVKLRLTGKRI